MCGECLGAIITHCLGANMCCKYLDALIPQCLGTIGFYFSNV